ncbi:MAG: SDR family NAD(P)-dependent oxidoreductase [Cyanobacteria bacterium REEB65]|nr:SDR family NAD(P)-dependent oxidoreductase [Cyanobacteria bacterium REEB65]
MPSAALVTGANRGIGREIARQLVQRGVQVVVTARASQKAAQTALEIGAAMSVGLDVTDLSSVHQAHAAVAERFSHLDGLVNNAAIGEDWQHDILEVDEATLRKILETNTFGALRVARVFWDLLKPGGRVVNMSSGMGQLSDPADRAAAYSLSKTALNGVTAQLAAAGTSDRISVNSVCPGWVRTDMGGPEATRSVSQGADTPVWLLLEASAQLTGKFLRDRQEIPW